MGLQNNASHLLVYVNSMDQCFDKLVEFFEVSSDQCNNKGHQVLHMACYSRDLELQTRVNYEFS